MKAGKIIAAALVCMLCMLLAGCVSQKENDELLAERDALLEERDSLKADVETLQEYSAELQQTIEEKDEQIKAYEAELIEKNGLITEMSGQVASLSAEMAEIMAERTIDKEKVLETFEEAKDTVGEIAKEAATSDLAVQIGVPQSLEEAEADLNEALATASDAIGKLWDIAKEKYDEYQKQENSR